jgi:hypothetical protein
VIDGVSAFKPMFVLVGDSITELGSMEGGWQQLLTKEYVRKVGTPHPRGAQCPGPRAPRSARRAAPSSGRAAARLWRGGWGTGAAGGGGGRGGGGTRARAAGR